VYCTHEYTLSNLRFAKAVEPTTRTFCNGSKTLPGCAPKIASACHQRWPGAPDQPFLRTSETSVKQKADERKGIQTLAAAVFAALRSWKDTF
jgi:hydroxyacylglutathione hydrolase